MKVGIVTGDHTASETGIGNYILNLISELKKTSANLSVIRHPKGHNYGVESEIIPRSPQSAGLMIWSCLVAVQKNQLKNLDIIHSPTLALFPFKPHDHYVFTAHDIVFRKFPQYLPQGTIRHTKLLFNRNLTVANHLISDSESTKKDLISYYKVPREKITVIPLAADPMYRPLPDQDKEKIRRKYSLFHPFILYVGTIEPRKNISSIFEAFAQIQGKNPGIELVIVGKKGWYYEEIFQRLYQLHITDKVRFLGYVPLTDLPALYNAATIFVYPSQYEGFGLPLLESMQCGTPVISSNRSSLPEIVGKGGNLINPDNPNELMSVIRQLLQNPEYYQEQRQYGLDRAKKFSWKKTAQQTYQVYEEILAGGK